jgi:hypothetical protein
MIHILPLAIKYWRNVHRKCSVQLNINCQLRVANKRTTIFCDVGKQARLISHYLLSVGLRTIVTYWPKQNGTSSYDNNWRYYFRQTSVYDICKINPVISVTPGGGQMGLLPPTRRGMTYQNCVDIVEKIRAGNTIVGDWWLNYGYWL